MRLYLGLDNLKEEKIKKIKSDFVEKKEEKKKVKKQKDKQKDVKKWILTVSISSKRKYRPFFSNQRRESWGQDSIRLEE